MDHATSSALLRN